MADRDDDRFRVRPAPPRQRGDAYVNRVLRQANKAGAGLGQRTGKAGRQPGARLGRGHVAARFGHRLAPNAQRAAVKVRLVNLAKAGPRSVAKHLRYLQREGVDRQGGPGRAYGPATDDADLDAFRETCGDDRHQFRLIVSPENAEQLDDLRTYTRHLMQRMEADLGTRLEWVAVDHWNTDNPHTHVVLRGKDQAGRDLIIARDYIAHGMRQRAAELATEWLGPRSEREIQQAMQRDVQQARWTGLDRALQRETGDDGRLPADRLSERRPLQRQLLIGRLQHLRTMGLAAEPEPGVWTVRADAEATLRALGERGDILRTLQRAMRGRRRELAIFEPGDDGRPLVGRVAGKGLADELYERGYLIVDGIDGKAHYVALPPKAELEPYPVGAVVEVRAPGRRDVDADIADLADSHGVYRHDHAVSVIQPLLDGEDPGWLIERHVRRLEALRRAGIVERLDEGVWRVPNDLPEQGRRYDAGRLGGVAVHLKSHLSIERQTRAVGATWLDQQLIGGGKGLGDAGFGAETRQALRERGEYPLMDHGGAP